MTTSEWIEYRKGKYAMPFKFRKSKTSGELQRLYEVEGIGLSTGNPIEIDKKIISLADGYDDPMIVEVLNYDESGYEYIFEGWRPLNDDPEGKKLAEKWLEKEKTAKKISAEKKRAESEKRKEAEIIHAKEVLKRYGVL